MAPKVKPNEKSEILVPYNYKADNWSLGVLVFQLLTGELPPDPPRFERKPTFHAGDFVNRLLRTKPENG